MVSASARAWEKGGYLVSGGLAISVICCQVFRIPHARLVASLLEKKKCIYNTYGRIWMNNIHIWGGSIGTF